MPGGLPTERAREPSCPPRAPARRFLSNLAYASLALHSLLISRYDASALESGSSSFRNTRSSIDSGGKRKTSTSFTQDDSAGEIAFTTRTSGGYRERGGLQGFYHYPGRIADLSCSSGTGPGQITLSWTAPGNDAQDAGTSALAYLIKRSSVAGQSPAISDTIFNAAASVTPAPLNPATQGTAESMTVDSLLAGVTYYFAMKAREADGLLGVLSVGCTVPAGIAPPGISTPTFTDLFVSSFTVNWTSGTLATGFNPLGTNYVAQVSSSSGFTTLVLSSETTSLFAAFTGLDPNTTYYARAAAFAGSSTTTYTSLGSTSTLANPVQNTQVFGIWITSITINWTPLPGPPPQRDSAEGYRMQISTKPDFSLLWAAFPSSATPAVALSTLTASSLTGGYTYFFRVGSLNWNEAANYAPSVSAALPTILSISISTHVYAFGPQGVGTSSMSATAVVVTNQGNVDTTYGLAGTTSTPGGSPWSMASTPSADTAALKAGFRSARPTSAQLAPLDALTDVNQASQTNAQGGRFTSDDAAASETGASVIPAAGRNLWLSLEMPTTSNTGAPQEFSVTLTAGTP